MGLTLLALQAGVLAGLLRGGTFAALARTRFLLGWLLFTALASQAVVLAIDPPRAAAWLALSLLLVLVFVGANLDRPGIGVVAIGVAANLAPILANGSMPVDPEALVKAGIATEAEVGQMTLSSGRHLRTADDDLAWLGDTIPVRGVRAVVSFGDLILMVGMADVLANLLLQARRRDDGEGADADADADIELVHADEASDAALPESGHDRENTPETATPQAVVALATTAASPVQD